MSWAVPPQWFCQFSVHGNTVWTPQKVFWMSLVMSWQSSATLREQFEVALDVLQQVRPRWALGTSLSGFLKAREHLTLQMADPLKQWLQQKVSAYFEQWRVRGWLLFGVDGSRFETCRTQDNEQTLGCAGKESTTPQVYQTTLLHIGTGLVWDYRLGPGTESERRQLDAMLPDLPRRSLLTADAGFISFHLCRWLEAQGIRFLLRVGSNIHLLTGLLGEQEGNAEVHGGRVYLWPQDQRHLPPVILRLIVIQAEGRERVTLVTNILDESELSDSDAYEIYQLRWGLELHYRDHKQTLGHDHLQSRTGRMTLTEQHWHVLATWILQWNTTRALIAAGQNPADWSAAKARNATRTLMRKSLMGDVSLPDMSYAQQLANATKDSYPRTGPKETRKWPRKKQDKPPKPAKIRPAHPREVKRAQQFRAELANKL
jgi:hypothetical protein